MDWKTACKIAAPAAACAGAFAFLIAPGHATRAQKAPFLYRNYAHRGLHTEDGTVPENSLPAFRAAAEAGYAVEMDVHLTADDQLVVFHDDTLERMCGVPGVIDDFTLAELRALRLGDHVHQAGSLVEPDRLRFDLTHFSAITPEELERVNEIVGDWILDGMDVTVSEMSMAQAKASGATALFSEKYGDVVRVVNMGGKSIELCGGTHVDNTAKIGPFRITGESSVASGVRRVEAITGKAYLREMEAVNRRMYAAAEVLHAKPADLIAKAKGFTAELKEARQNVERMKEKILHSDVDRFLYASKNIGGIKVITTTRTDLDAGDLRKLGDFLRDKDPDTVAVLATATESKVTFVAVCGKNAVAKGIRAGDLVRAVSAVTGGKGGGKPDSAMGGGSEVLKIDDALAIVDDFVAEKLGL